MRPKPLISCMACNRSPPHDLLIHRPTAPMRSGFSFNPYSTESRPDGPEPDIFRPARSHANRRPRNRPRTGPCPANLAGQRWFLSRRTYAGGSRQLSRFGSIQNRQPPALQPGLLLLRRRAGNCQRGERPGRRMDRDRTRPAIAASELSWRLPRLPRQASILKRQIKNLAGDSNRPRGFFVSQFFLAGHVRRAPPEASM